MKTVFNSLVLLLLSSSVLTVLAADPVDRWLDNTAEVLQSSSSEYSWKFAHPAPPVSNLPPVWQAGFDWLEGAADNKLKIKMYGGGALYGVTGGFKALRVTP